MALVFAALLTAGFAPLVAIPLDCLILGLPIELSSIGSPKIKQSRGMATRGANPAVSSAAKTSAMTSFSFT